MLQNEMVKTVSDLQPDWPFFYLITTQTQVSNIDDSPLVAGSSKGCSGLLTNNPVATQSRGRLSISHYNPAVYETTIVVFT